MTYQTRVNGTLITSNDLTFFMKDVKGYIERMYEKPRYNFTQSPYKYSFTNKRELSMVEEIAMGYQRN